MSLNLNNIYVLKTIVAYIKIFLLVCSVFINRVQMNTKDLMNIKSRSDEHKRSVRNCDCDKNEIAKHCWEADHNFNWDQKKVIDRESRLIPRKIKETIHSLKNPNHINKISYMLPEIWLPNLR